METEERGVKWCFQRSIDRGWWAWRERMHDIQVSGLPMRQTDDRRKSPVPVTSWKWKRGGGVTQQRGGTELWPERSRMSSRKLRASFTDAQPVQPHRTPHTEGLWAWSSAMLAILKFTIILSVNLGFGASSWTEQVRATRVSSIPHCPIHTEGLESPRSSEFQRHQAWQFSETQNEYKISVSWKLGALNLFAHQNPLLLFHVHRTYYVSILVNHLCCNNDRRKGTGQWTGSGSSGSFLAY